MMHFVRLPIATAALLLAVTTHASAQTWREALDHTLVTTVAGYATNAEGSAPYVAQMDYYVSPDSRLNIRFNAVNVNNQQVPMPDERLVYVVDLKAGAGRGTTAEESYSYSAAEADGVLAVTIDYANAVSGATGQMIFEIGFAPGVDCTVKLTGHEDDVTFDLRSAACQLEQGPV